MRFVSNALHEGDRRGGRCAAVLIPVQMLRNLVVERAQLREQAVASVSRGWGGQAAHRWPDLAIPATWIVEDTRTESRTGSAA